MKSKSRRKFIQQSVSAGAIAGVELLTNKTANAQTASSSDKVAGANDRIRVALIGCGGQGRGDLRQMLRLKNIECVALCDVDDAQSAEAKKQITEPVGQKPQLVTKDFRKVLEQKDIDAVIIGTPDHWHALPTIMACQAGKDVYVEKPLSISVAEGRAMVNAARKYNRVVQMGTQQRSATHFTQAVDYVKSGKLGKIRLVRAWAYQDWMGNIPKVPDSDPPPTVDYDMWLGPATKRPFNKNRFHFNFRWYWDYSGGLMTDWGVHMIDIAVWGMNVKAPLSTMAIGGKYGFPDDAEETPDTQQVLFEFSDFSMLWEHATAIGRGPEARDHGVAFHGNNGTLVVDRGGWEVYSEIERKGNARANKMMPMPRQATGNEEYHFLHVKNFVECLKSRNKPNSDVETGHNSTMVCHLGNLAFRLGRKIKWDVENEKAVGDAEAQALVNKPYREPWKLPMV